MRRSLSTTARVRIFRAGGGLCSICGLRIDAGQDWDVSHETPLALGGADEESNMKPAHRACHRRHTAEVDLPQVAKAKRQEARHIGAKVSARPMPGSRRSGLRKRMNGKVERRES